MKKIVASLLLFAVLTLALPLLAVPMRRSEADVQAPPASIPAAAQVSDATKPQETAFNILDEASGQIMQVSVHDYIVGAIAAEMPVTWPDEALKAQGVAAYSYALSLKSSADPNDAALKGADFKANPSARLGYTTKEVQGQLWAADYEQNRTRLETIAKEIEGQSLVYEGAPALSCYHAISAGATESAENVWGSAVPYLVSAESGGDLEAEGYETKEERTALEVKEAFAMSFAGIHPEDDAGEWFKNPVLTQSGYVKQISACGATVSGNDLRTALSLRSAAFTIEYKDGVFTFTTHGYGHGVGMSQYGACSMAREGKTYKEILAHYYKGAVLEGSQINKDGE